jgi:hypothetical protein
LTHDPIIRSQSVRGTDEGRTNVQHHHPFVRTTLSKKTKTQKPKNHTTHKNHLAWAPIINELRNKLQHETMYLPEHDFQKDRQRKPKVAVVEEVGEVDEMAVGGEVGEVEEMDEDEEVVELLSSIKVSFLKLPKRWK